MNEVEIRPDRSKGETTPAMKLKIRSVDEIVIGDWLHLERMKGTDKRVWCLLINDQNGRVNNITIVEKNGKVLDAFTYDSEWERP
jgi:hypothetical protein